MKILLGNQTDFDNALAEIDKEKPKGDVSYFGKPPYVEPKDKPYTMSDSSSLTIYADDFVKKTLDEAGIPYEDLVDFSNWELRFDAVAQCKTLVNESPITIPDGQGGTLPLRAMIQEWYTGAMEQVNDFIKTGSKDFLELIENGDEFWWDLVSSEEAGSVRTQAINLIKPLVV